MNPLDKIRLRVHARRNTHERMAPFLAGLSDAANERSMSAAYLHHEDYYLGFCCGIGAVMASECERESASEGRKLH